MNVKFVARVRSAPLSAEHECVLEIGPVQADDNFEWPILEAEDASVFSELRRLH